MARRLISTTSESVELRPYYWDMLDALISIADDPRIPRYMGDRFPSPYTRADGEQWLNEVVPVDPPTQYAIYADGSRAGGTGAVEFSHERSGVAEIGWWLHPDWWGQGVATDAVGALIEEFFTHRETMRLYAPIMAPNSASIRVAEKVGLRFEGVSLSGYVKHGVRHDSINYGLTREQWESGR